MTVPLGTVLSRSIEAVDVVEGHLFALAGVYSFGRGVLLRAPVPGEYIAAKQLFRIRAGQIIYSKLTAFEGAFACIGPDGDGRVVSNEFPAFDVDRSIAEPEYLNLILCRPATWDELVYSIPGGGSRRERFQIEDFLEFPVDLPPLDEQRRVVDTVRTARIASAALAREAAAAKVLIQACRMEWIERSDAALASLERLVVGIDAGKSPKCPDRPVMADEWGILKVSAIRSGEFRPRECKPLPEDLPPFTQAKVALGDILYSRANTEKLVGAVCRVEVDPGKRLLCDKTLRVTLNEDLVDPVFFVEAMTCPTARDHIELSATGTSESMKNISQETFCETEIPLPAIEKQRDIARRLQTLRRAARIADERAAQIETLVESLVEEFITGTRRAPTVSSRPEAITAPVSGTGHESANEVLSPPSVPA